jgi:tetratricopeptide (TPR) repeat protein
MRGERPILIGASAVVFAAPLALGGARSSIQLVLSLALFVVAVGFFVLRRRVGVAIREFAAVGCLAVVAILLQLVPVPAGALARLSPAAAELRLEVSPHESFFPITVDAPATWIEAARSFSWVALVVVIGTLAQNERRYRFVLWTIASAGATVGLIHFTQRLVGTNKIFGLYSPPSPSGGGVFGTFVTANHAAALCSLSGLIALGLSLEKRQSTIRAAAAVIAVVCATCVVLSGSRAGAAAFGLGFVAVVGVALKRRFGVALALGGALLVAIAGGALSLGVGDTLRTRLSAGGVSGLLDNQKTRGWRATIDMIRAYPVFGVGRGAIEAPLAAFRSTDEGVRLVYPENAVLQVIGEFGTVVGLALVVLFFMHGARILRGPPLSLALVGTFAGVTAVALHELANFALELAGVSLPFAAALGVLGAQRDKRSKRRAAPVLLAIVLLCWAGTMAVAATQLAHTLDADVSRIEAGIRGGRNQAEVAKLLAEAQRRHPADGHLQLLDAYVAFQARDPSAIAKVNRTLNRQPTNWQAHRLAAHILARLGRPDQAALELRLAWQTGMSPRYDEIIAVAGRATVDAIPAERDALLGIARELARRHRGADVHRACARLSALGVTVGIKIECIGLRVAARADFASIRESVEEVLAMTPPPEVWLGVANALEAASEYSRFSEEVLRRALTVHPNAALLVLGAARLRIARGDIEGAKTALASGGTRGFSLADRQSLEELLAEIAERTGRTDEAAAARARAHSIARQRQMANPSSR